MRTSATCSPTSGWRSPPCRPPSRSDQPSTAPTRPHEVTVIATVDLRARRSLALGDPLTRAGTFVWRTLTNVRFAVLQITVLTIAGLIGTLVRQIPAFALRDPAAYAEQLARLHTFYDPLTILGVNVGPAMVDVFERLGFFRVFSAPWFLLVLTLLTVSILVCTLDRMPRLWRSIQHVQPVQSPAFYDLRLANRAVIERADLPADDLERMLRRRRFKTRRTQGVDRSGEPVVHLYGDRNRYFKMATLLTHLGLILFLGGAAITAGLGYETVLFVGEGQTAPVQPVGSPRNLLVKNIQFDAPTNPDGGFADFRTDLAVYRDGREVARKTIRVNDPLTVDGFVFHQNTFGPAAGLEIHEPGGRLVWRGPVLLAGDLAGLSQGFLTVPGSSLGLLVLLQATDGVAPLLAVSGLAPGVNGDASELRFITRIGLGGSSDPRDTAGYRITWRNAAEFTGLVVRRDPGEWFIWLAALSLIAGLVLSFYFPRRRFWARVGRDETRMALVAERPDDCSSEFATLVEELASRTERRPLTAADPA